MSVLVRPPFPAAGVHLLATAMGLAAVDALGPPGRCRGRAEVAQRRGRGRSRRGRHRPEAGRTARRALQPARGARRSWWASGSTWRGRRWASRPSSPPPRPRSTCWGVRSTASELAVEVLTRFEALTAGLADRAACDALVAQYRARCVTLGRRVRVVQPVGEIVGTAVGLASDGSLEVRDADGVAPHASPWATSSTSAPPEGVRSARAQGSGGVGGGPPPRRARRRACADRGIPPGGARRAVGPAARGVRSTRGRPRSPRRAVAIGTVASVAGVPSASSASSSTARVTPARQPESSGGVTNRSSSTTNTLEPVPSQSSSRVLANSASEHPASVGERQRHDVLAVGGRLQARQRAAARCG